MSNYRRLISYIYAYEGGIKGKNIGFAKIETRGIQCKITVSAKRIYVGGNDIGVYLLAGDQEIFLGNIFVRGGSGEFRTTVSANDVERSGINMDQCYGLTIHDVKSTWRCYTTIWEDAVAHAAEVDLENAVSASREKEQAEISEEQIKKAVQEIEEEFPLETDAPKTSAEESGDHSGELKTVQEESVPMEQEPAERENLQVQAESGVTSGESLVHEETVSEEPALKEIVSEEINKDPISEETTGERLLKGNPAWAELAGESLPDESPANGEKTAETLNGGTLLNEESVSGESGGTLFSENDVNEDLAGEDLLYSEESVNEELTGGNLPGEEYVIEDTAGDNLLYSEKSVSEESVNKEPVIEARTSDGSGHEQLEWNKPDEPEQRVIPSGAFASGAALQQNPFSPATGPVPERRPLPRQFMSGWRQRNQPSAARTMQTGQPQPRPAAQGMPPTIQPQPHPAAQGMPPTIQPQPHPAAQGVPPTIQPQPYPAAQGVPPTIQPQLRPAAQGVPPTIQPQLRPAAQGVPPTIQPLPRPAVSGVQPIGQPMPRPAATEPFGARRPLPYPSAPATSLFGQPSLNQQNAGQESRQNEAVEAPEIQVKGTGSSQPVEMTFSEPYIPQSGQDTAGTTVYQADAVVKEAPGFGGTQPSLGDPEELERLLQTEDSDEIPHDLIWEKLKHEHTRVLAFDYEDGCEILTIKPQDIGILPRDTWLFGNNSFLLHGYYNYRYLILAKLLNPQGDPRYILGIPGHFYSNERYMASMFGFPNFVLSKEQPVEDGRFGFWYTDIKLGG